MTDAEAVKLIGSASELNAISRKIKRSILGQGIRRLQTIRNSIANAAGLPMPPIRIVPWGLTTPNPAGVVWGYVSHVDCGAIQRIGAFMPASTLIAIDSDKLLR